MNPLLIAGGVYLTARVLHCIFDELTDQERAKEEKIRKSADAYNRRIAAFKEINEQHEGYYQRELILEVQKRNESFLEDARERQTDEQTLYEEIRASIHAVNSVLISGETTTALRRSGLERLLNQLHEGKERCFGYQQYLKQYISFVERELEREDVEPFSMRIPSEYPYTGKLYHIPVGELANGGILLDKSLPGIPIAYCLAQEESLSNYEDDCVLPFMAEQYDLGRQAHVLSLAKGTFYTEALENTRIGVRAVVSEIQQRHIVLTYQDSLRLMLRRENLMKPYRTPPVRSEMTVYPVRWTYGLISRSEEDCPVRVSEKLEDATAGFRFELFPMVFTGDQWTRLTRYMEENRITYEDEWKIGPLEDAELGLKDGLALKLQFGDALVCRASLYAMPDRAKKNGAGHVAYILAFQEILLPTAGFQADDIFVDIDVDMTPVAVDYFDAVGKYIDLQEAQLFLLDVFTEFQTQKTIKESMSGSRYFQQWGVINQKLIAYLKKGQEFSARVANVEKDKNNLLLEIRNHDQLRKQIENYTKEQELRRNGSPGKVNLFIEDDTGLPCGIFIAPDFCTATVFNCSPDALPQEKEFSLPIYAESVPYPEIQQSIALSQLRIGRLVNPALQAAMMYGENISSDVEDIGEIILKNPSIAKDAPQYDALVRALAEKSIFFIQGPPGTGKTTVIRELVEQQLLRYPSSRILIVSQANVAVDNALSGIVRDHEHITIRCGNATKVSRSLQPVMLDNKYARYINSIESMQGRVDEDIYSKWMEFVAPESGINPNIGELIIKSCKIVGATCIGLAKKRIGLERIEFDLVIIDEAGKALPGEILIPVLRARKLVMIGDHMQLPPVINPALYDPEKIELEDRDVIESCLFSVSLFQRLFESAPESNKTMLQTQYRMPAVVGTMVSELFYNKQLENGAGTDDRKPLYSGSNLTFYDFSRDRQYREEKREEFGLINVREADFVTHLLLRITESSPGHSIAVITPYRGQMRLIQNRVLQADHMLRKENIRVNTIDAFQGDEAEIVIYCTTRGRKHTLFFSDVKRINVALSRARNELIIVGRAQYFDSYRRESSPLPAIADYIQAHGKIISVSPSAVWDIRRERGFSEQMVPMGKVFCYQALDQKDTQSIAAAVQYYYENGHMERPICVHLEGDRYIVDSNVDIFMALRELELNECWVKLASTGSE